MPRRHRAALVATSLAALLLSVGCGARAVTPQASAPVAAAPASSPSTAAGVPAALQGHWLPVSKALEGPGPLTLSAQGLRWAPCGQAPRTATSQAAGDALVLTPAGQPACQLDSDRFTHLRIQPRAGNACEMEVSLYEGAAQLAKQERLAWGVYQREGCKAP